jgi:hypothetical protein
MPRSCDEIVEEIEKELRPLKRRIYKPPGPRPLPLQKVIESRIDLIKQVASRLKLPNWRSVRDNARKALPLVEALEKQAPTLTAAAQIEPLTHLVGSDSRLDTLQWLCGHGAIVLIAELSESSVEAVPCADGKAHVIAKLLFEAVTGIRASRYSLLQSVKKAKRFRDGNNDAAPRVVVRDYFRLSK